MRTTLILTPLFFANFLEQRSLLDFFSFRHCFVFGLLFFFPWASSVLFDLGNGAPRSFLLAVRPAGRGDSGSLWAALVKRRSVFLCEKSWTLFVEGGSVISPDRSLLMFRQCCIFAKNFADFARKSLFFGDKVAQRSAKNCGDLWLASPVSCLPVFVSVKHSALGEGD
jgi:hypothetical protein